MLHIFHLGPILAGGEPGYLLVAADERGPRPPAHGRSMAQGLAALQKQLKGAPARVAPELADEGRALGLESAPLPEPLQAMRALLALVTAHGPGLKPGRPEPVLAFARAAAAFYKAAPWKTWHDEEPIRAELNGAVRHTFEGVILGGAGEEFGLALYEQPGALEQVNEIVERRGVQARGAHKDALAVMTGSEELAYALPPLREVFGLEVVPMAMRVRRGKFPALGDIDLLALAAALEAASKLRPDHLEAEAIVDLGGGLRQTARLRIQAPGSRRAALGLEPEKVVPLARAAGPASKAGSRAEPPPGPEAPSPRPAVLLTPDESKELDLRVLAFAQRHFGKAWLKAAQRAFPIDFDPERESAFLQLYMPWLVNVFHRQDEPTARAAFLERQRRQLSPRQVAFLEGQHREYLSLWRIGRVEPEVGLELADQLTGETVFVHERLGTRGAQTGLGMLGRVADVKGEYIADGMHPHLLMPVAFGQVVRAAFVELGVRGKTVPRALLANGTTDLLLMDLWEEAVEASTQLPRLVNADGDPLVEVTDRFAFPAAQRGAVLAGLTALAQEREPADGGPEVFVFLKRKRAARGTPAEEVVLGRASVGADGLELSTNSHKRARTLRQRVEKKLGTLLRFVERKEVVLEDELRKPQAVEDDEPEPHSPSEQQAVRELKAHHYARWVDEPLPALGGLSPRQAARGDRSREVLRQILDQVQVVESGHPAGERFDVADLRRELGLDP